MRLVAVNGGESGIRTHGRFDPSAVFKTAALNHSAISPLDTAPGDGAVAIVPAVRALTVRKRCGPRDAGRILSCLGDDTGRGRGDGARRKLRDVLRARFSLDFAALQASGLDEGRGLLGDEVDEHTHRRQQTAA